MMEKTYYEVLEVPANASPADILSAFRLLQSIYDTDSLSTYSLFSSSEREKILIQAEEAFSTLTDPARRAAYDRDLISRGQLSKAKAYASKPKSPTPVFRTGAENTLAMARMREKFQQPNVREIKAGLMKTKRISGPRLKALRRAAGISLGDIFEASRVSVATLEAIEEEDRESLPAEVYLKGFLKSYAECLGLDPDRVTASYMS